MGTGNSEDEVAHCKVQGQPAVGCVKTAIPTEMPYGLRARIGLKNHVLDEVQVLHGKGQF